MIQGHMKSNLKDHIKMLNSKIMVNIYIYFFKYYDTNLQRLYTIVFHSQLINVNVKRFFLNR